MSLDFPALLLAIRHQGVTEEYIARYAGTSRHAISRWIRGVNHKEPGFTVALKMLRLHRRECPDRHEAEVYERI